MLNKFGLFISFCIFFISSSSLYSMSGWDKNNKPELMGKNYKRIFSELPLIGDLPSNLWSGDYWPSYMGGITYRWNQKKSEKESDRYGYDFLQEYELKNAVISELSPAEKYDLYMGDLDFTLSMYERKRTQILKTIKGSSKYDPKFKIPEWEGLCHAWAPATIQYKNPGPVEAIGRRGHVIPFGSSDIKALLTYNIHLNDNPDVVFLGSRCLLDFSKLEEQLKKGEITEEQYQKEIESAECEDTNAGAFHLALTNQIGVKQESFIIDITRDQEVWNQAVQRYSSEVLEVFEGVSEGTAPGTVREVLVETKVEYVNEIPHSWTNEIVEEGIESEIYSYWLEIDKKGRIVGGSWDSFERPDFIWNQGKTPFGGFFQDLKYLYNKSIGLSDRPVEKWKKISKKLGKRELYKKKFVKGLRKKALQRKLDKAIKMAQLKARFLNKLKERRKKTRKKKLVRKLKKAGQLEKNKIFFVKNLKKAVLKRKVKKITHNTGKKRKVISHIKREVVKTKFKKDVKKAVLTKKYINKLKKEALKTKLKKNVLRSLYIRKILSSWKGKIIERNFYKNSKKLSDVKKFSSKLKSEVLKSRLKRKVNIALMVKSLGTNLKKKVIKRKWSGSLDRLNKKKEVVKKLKDKLVEKKLRTSLHKYKNVKTFTQNLKDKVERKKNLYQEFFKAIENNNEKVFLDHFGNIDLTFKNEKNQNALMVASQFSRFKFARHILENGGRPWINDRDKFGKNSLSILLYQLSKDFSQLKKRVDQEKMVSKSFKVVRLLVRNGVDINHIDKNGKRPRHYSRLIWKLTKRFTKKIDRFLDKNGAKRF